MRVTVVLVFGLVLLAGQLGLDILLGGFVAGMIVRVALKGHELSVFESKLTAVGFGFFIPFFFITSGIEFDLAALGSVEAIAKLMMFFVLFLVVRGTPALLLYRERAEQRGQRMALAFYSATELPLVVAITTIAIDDGKMKSSTAAGLVGAAMLSTLIFPFVGAALLKRAARPARNGAPGARPDRQPDQRRFFFAFGGLIVRGWVWVFFVPSVATAAMVSFVFRVLPFFSCASALGLEMNLERPLVTGRDLDLGVADHLALLPLPAFPLRSGTRFAPFGGREHDGEVDAGGRGVGRGAEEQIAFFVDPDDFRDSFDPGKRVERFQRRLGLRVEQDLHLAADDRDRVGAAVAVEVGDAERRPAERFGVGEREHLGRAEGPGAVALLDEDGAGGDGGGGVIGPAVADQVLVAVEVEVAGGDAVDARRRGELRPDLVGDAGGVAAVENVHLARRGDVFEAAAATAGGADDVGAVAAEVADGQRLEVAGGRRQVRRQFAGAASARSSRPRSRGCPFRRRG